ncbi:Dam family site-specific DNA-(adenine-N6)-methyltransferase [Prevotella sp. PCHR]|uniref:site-specific DNA-methyltransferase (adenine-specific) n=1 Tax=Xylanibacter caecicola TaxID=2736294 RepID=A0ABX2B302_9BACT|nr:Dam family site-specific DNA-(adenine-N6)-methyltransferase [Xylanibacter caecicola]NPE25641.1 Dam family site-specific DNA-(adenine-N6)-methyltransferase [Xylanibacter caecicola]
MFTSYSARPFVKWVGGKGQLLSQLERILPIELDTDSFTYVEPFVGGGAMLFFMLQRFSNIKRVIINDINKNLTDTYKMIKSCPDGLVLKLKYLDKEYKALRDEESRKDFFLMIRSRFNEYDLSELDRSAFFMFLNKTCFNGLYRENSAGRFNVPFGKYTNPTICNEDVIYADSELMNKCDVHILNGDFSQTLNYVNEQDLFFFYFDPPYRPLSSTASFNSYVKEAFNDAKQRELADFCRMISARDNCLWMLSNSDCSAKNPKDLFFENIYEGFDIRRVYASRYVNAVASKRGKLTELVIRNYRTSVKTKIIQSAI